MNFGDLVIMMSKFGSKSGDFAQRESLMTLWNDFNFALTEPQKDYLNEQNEFKLLTLKINDLDKANSVLNKKIRRN